MSTRGLLIETMTDDTNEENSIDSIQMKLVQHKFNEVLEILKNANIKLWLKKSKYFAKIFHCVAAVGAVEIMKYLVQTFPNDLEVKNITDSTILFTSIECQQDEMTKLLIDCGMNLTITNARKYSLLHLISRRRGDYYLSLAEKILNLDEELLNQQNLYGETPLHIACLSGNYEMVELLIGKGADVFTETINGKTPIDYAIESVNSLRIVPYLNKIKNEQLFDRSRQNKKKNPLFSLFRREGDDDTVEDSPKNRKSQSQFSSVEEEEDDDDDNDEDNDDEDKKKKRKFLIPNFSSLYISKSRKRMNSDSTKAIGNGSKSKVMGGSLSYSKKKKSVVSNDEDDTFAANGVKSNSDDKLNVSQRNAISSATSSSKDSKHDTPNAQEK